jgi:fatty-acyl-CoA synthase
MDDLVATARAAGLGDVLRRTALRVPDKPALVDGELRWSYRELDRAVNRAAAALAERGVGRGDRVVLLSHNCWQYVVLVYALARLGVIAVPINFTLGPAEIAFVLEHCGARAIIAEDGLTGVADTALSAAGVRPVLRGWIGPPGKPAVDPWEDVAPWVEGEHRDEPGVLVGDDDVLRLMYTSGTESRPKGAMLTSRCLIAQYVSCVVDAGMTAADVDVHAMPMYHCAQLDCFLGSDVYLGATSIVLRGPDPEAILAAIEREGATKLFAPPTVWIALLRHAAFDGADLSSLRKGYYGASPMPVEVLAELCHRLPDVRLWNLYGQTEMAPLATMLPPEEQVSHAGSAGRPVVNVETRVVDDTGRDVSVGEVGEIVHRSPQATVGYWRDEVRTREAFRDGWFHSGDLGVLSADGHLTVVDRKKDMIKSGGENVASREVEETIYLLEGVAEVAVFGIPDERWIEAVTAVVVPRPGAELTPGAVIAHCRAQLAGFKTPKRVIVADALPKNPSGKILKRELRERYASSGTPLATEIV